MGLVLLEVFPNEIMARFWEDLLRDDGIVAVVKPQLGGYGVFGTVSLMHHGIYVDESELDRAREVLAGQPEENP